MENKWRKLFNKKSAGLWIFVGAALVVAVLLAVIVSPWASSSPDGLDKTAEEKGFVEKAEQQEPAWRHSPIPGYAMPGVKNEKVATGLSGLVGVLITLAVAVAVGLLALGLARFRNTNKTTGDKQEKSLET
jgi:cobalt/nickel transport protein